MHISHLLLKFKEKAQVFVSEFKQELDKQDYETITRLAHSFKTMAGNIGAVDLQSKAGTLEQVCQKQKANETIIEIVNTIDSALTPILESFEQLETPVIALKSDDSGIEIDTVKLKSLFTQLRVLLEDDDADASDIVEEINKRISPNTVNIDGYPTIMSMNGDEIDYYKGERTAELMGGWINSMKGGYRKDLQGKSATKSVRKGSAN